MKENGIGRSYSSFGGEMRVGVWWLKGRKNRLVKPRHRWEENIQIDFGEINVTWHRTRKSSGLL
jgi:hypothetical protein